MNGPLGASLCTKENLGGRRICNFIQKLNSIYFNSVIMAQAQFPNDLVQQYLQASDKLKKFERVVFKRFAPNVSEVSSDFSTLAVKFHDACMFQYSGMCYLGAAKCEKSLGNSSTEIDFLLRSARAFVKANQEIEKLELRSNNQEYIEGALKTYDQALAELDNNSPMKAAVIREIKKINPNCESTSSFSSPCHRTYDLELSAIESIKDKDFVSALDKLTEIFENIIEHKTVELYSDVLDRIEVTRLLLLLVLDLPPARQSPSHIKLLEKYSNVLDDDFNSKTGSSDVPICVQITLKDLTLSCIDKDTASILESIDELCKFTSLKNEQQLLLRELARIYNN